MGVPPIAKAAAVSATLVGAALNVPAVPIPTLGVVAKSCATTKY